MTIDSSTQKDKQRFGYDAATLRACWLVLVNQGGWWDAKELRQEMEIHPELIYEVVVTDRISGSLSHAAQYNFVTCRTRTDGKGLNQYAVMPDNCVPRGMAIKHIVR